MKPQSARVSPSSPSGSSPLFRRVVDWTVKPVAFVFGLVASVWRSRAGRAAPAATAQLATRTSRREEKRRRKELVRAAKSAGRRRAA